MQECDLAGDLTISRLKAGLSNKDMAHLLDVDPGRISRLEQGRSSIRTSELCALAMIYGKAMHELVPNLAEQVIGQLTERLNSMPPEPSTWEKFHDARLDTLNGLFERLMAVKNDEYDI